MPFRAYLTLSIVKFELPNDVLRKAPTLFWNGLVQTDTKKAFQSVPS